MDLTDDPWATCYVENLNHRLLLTSLTLVVISGRDCMRRE